MYRQQCAVDPAYQSLTTNTVNTPISQQQQQQQQQQGMLCVYVVCITQLVHMTAKPSLHDVKNSYIPTLP